MVYRDTGCEQRISICCSSIQYSRTLMFYLCNMQIFFRDIFIDERIEPKTITMLALAPVARPEIYCHAIYQDGHIETIKETSYKFTDGNTAPFFTLYLSLFTVLWTNKPGKFFIIFMKCPGWILPHIF